MRKGYVPWPILPKKRTFFQCTGSSLKRGVHEEYHFVFDFGGSFVKSEKWTLLTSWWCHKGYVELGLRLLRLKACVTILRCGVRKIWAFRKQRRSKEKCYCVALCSSVVWVWPIWNALPTNLQFADSVDVFKSQLKTHLFRQAFG